MKKFPFLWQYESVRYTEFYKASCVSEQQVVTDIASYLARFHVDVAVIDAGGKRSRGQMLAIAKKNGLLASAMRPLINMRTGSAFPEGFSDIEATLAPGGKALYIEVKAPEWLHPKRAAGQPTEAQLHFLYEKWKRGALVMVAWSVGDVEWFVGPHVIENFRAMTNAAGRQYAALG
jgi:hypothetical protein